MSEEKKINLKNAVKNTFNSPKARRLIIFVGIIVVFATGFSVYSSAYSHILPHVTVNGVNVGRMTVDQAKEKIDAEFADMLEKREIVLKCGENKRNVRFSDLKTRIKSEETAEDAYKVGRSNGFMGKVFSIMTSMVKEKKVPLAVEVDEKLFDSIISEIASEYETPVQETGYTLENNVLTIVKGHNGRRVNRDKALKLFKDAACDAKTSEIEFVAEEAGPHKVDLEEFYAELTAPAKNAEYKLENGEVVIVEDKPKIEVDKAEIKKALESPQNTYSVNVKVTAPEVTAEELKSLLFRDVIGSYSSNFATSSAARASNVRLTAERINGYILMPGDIFSYDKTVGRRTVANGYKEAGVYVGNKVESGVGGGICQTSSTLYSAALYANLEIVQRTSHSLPVAYVPAGQDATIAEGYIDLKIKNNTGYPVKIVATVTGRNLECRILGVKVPGQTVELAHWKTADFEPKTERKLNTEIPKGYKKIIQKGARGYSIASKRIVKQNGETVKEEKLTNSVYRAANAEEEVNPADENTPSDRLKVYTGVEEIPVKEENSEESQKTESRQPSEEKPEESENVTEEVPGVSATQPNGDLTIIDIEE